MNKLKGQNKRFDKTKNENAITLVALIITIIILIILAVVTINSLTHEGLADMAVKSTQDYQKAQSDEMNMLNEIDTMVKEAVKGIQDGMTSDKENGGNGSEGDNSSDENKELTLDDIESITQDDVGKIIKYAPTPSTYPKNTLDSYSGSTNNQEFTTENLEWIVWRVEEEYVYLISKTITEQKLTVAGRKGCINYNTLLHDICSKLYRI